MRRIAFLIACALMMIPALQFGQDEPKTRTFAISMRYSFSLIPKNLLNMNFWFPGPAEDDLQSIHNKFLQAPYGMQKTTYEDTGNMVMHMTSGPRGGAPITVRVTFDVERTEERRTSFEPASRSSEDHAAVETMKQKWLQPDSHTVIDEALVQRAAEITSGRNTSLEKARSIYEHVLDTIQKVDDPRAYEGSGFGNVKVTLTTKRGNSVDMAAVFVGLCRAAGIPARTVIGMKIPSVPRSGLVREYHSWAEFYLDGIGWVPTDPADGQRGGSMRGYYFGSIDENRLTISRGRDIMLVPPQAGDPLNYLVNPYWEGNDEPQPRPVVEIRYTELEKIPDSFGSPAEPEDAPPPPQTSSR